MRRHVERRLIYLWVFELLNAALVFPLLYAVIARAAPLGRFSLVALAIVCSILVVGASFWFLKWRALRGSATLGTPSARRFYRATKKVFAAAVVMLPVLFLVRVIQADASAAELIVGFAFACLAGLEYVNYYHVQLSYDNREDIRYLLTHRRLKTATMVRELGI